MNPESKSLRIGDSRIDFEANLINGERVDSKSMAVLMALIHAAPGVVSIEDLLDDVWGGVVVGDNVVHQAIATIRKALQDNPRKPQYIETIPRKGYRLITTPSHGNTRLSAHGSAKTLGTALLLAALLFTTMLFLQVDEEHIEAEEKLTIAVMNFRDLSPDQNHAWLAEGLPNDLRTRLATSDRLRVLPWGVTQNFSLEQMPEDVSRVLHGVVQGAGDTVTVDLELIDARSGIGLWADSLTGNHPEPLQLQEQIAARLARFLEIVTPENPFAPRSSAAQIPYFRYLYFSGGGNTDMASYWIDRTLDADPDWGPGWRQKATNLIFAALFRSTTLETPAIDSALKRADELGTDTTVVRGDVAWYQGDLPGAERYFAEAAMAGNPHNYLGLMLSSGLVNEALFGLNLLLETMPYHTGAADTLAFAYITTGNPGGAYEASRHCADLIAPIAFRCMYGSIWAMPRLGMIEESEELLTLMHQAMADESSTSATHGLLANQSRLLEAQIAHMTDDEDRMLALIDHLAFEQRPFFAAVILLQLGHEQRAIELLRNLERLPPDSAWHWFSRRAYTPEKYRSHPAVVEFEARLGYTAEWRLELCRRANRMPEATFIRCDPSGYLLDE